MQAPDLLAVAAPTASSIAALVAVLVAMWRSDKRMDGVDSRLDKLDSRLDKMDGRMNKMDDRFDRVDADLRRFFEFYGRHDEAIETLKKKMG